ncbi:hypothetical protein HHK36_006747 [Tetracentron sinense]|uniref:HMG-Y-related protein A n=1 Tax=Tetracentron sinense TaxID=13715 RepID=A0A835DPE2_TETSI|nr:hypothetical protein HHK36_006747 [Tetracentron sinense]
MATEEVDKPPPLPPYPEMIFAAIDALNDKEGSSKSAISNHIESSYGDVPAGHSSLLSHHLNRMKESGELIMAKNNYMRPNPDAPPKRGRGRPPKPKLPVPPGTVLSPPRPRGRPPKPRDPSAMAAESPKVSSGSGKSRGRGRGRPPKKARTTAAVATTAPTGSPRPRGRPPKHERAREEFLATAIATIIEIAIIATILVSIATVIPVVLAVKVNSIAPFSLLSSLILDAVFMNSRQPFLFSLPIVAVNLRV